MLASAQAKPAKVAPVDIDPLEELAVELELAEGLQAGACDRLEDECEAVGAKYGSGQVQSPP